MDEAKRDLVKAWLLKALHDLAAARTLGSGEHAYLDTAIYHCQQAAEKAIKGLLVFHDRRFDKIHDLEVLIGSALPFEPTLDSWREVGDLLTPYAVAFRYPGDVMLPTREEFEEALSAAKRLVAFILSILPADVRPSEVPDVLAR